MLGSAWKTLDIIDSLEKTLGLPVIHPGPARCWETQLRLGLRHPMPGYGRLLAEMPA
jgi:maleate cis-trans isomerase